MTWHYTLYGLRLTADLPIPGLHEAPPTAAPDVRIRFAEPPPSDFTAALQPWSPPAYPRREGGVGYSIWRDPAGSLFRFRYPDGTEFVLDTLGSSIWVSWLPPLTQADAVTYLVGPIIGFVLRWRGRLCLHASCVSSGERAFSMMGSAGAGKSTTASAFATLGLPVVSDDITAITEDGGRFLVLPGYPRTCLWPTSASALFGHADALPAITPSWDKRHLDLTRAPGGFRSEPVPLDLIYVLADRSSGDAPITITEVDPGQALVALTGHTYGNRLLDTEMRASEFAALDRLVRTVPVRRVTPPESLERLTELCERMLDDFHSVIPR
ncbi:MAG TPA: hypothetical protein VFZ56_05105 [Gemmatimonadaceae bacterium]